MATYTPKEVTFRAHVWVEAVNVILPSENVTVIGMTTAEGHQ